MFGFIITFLVSFGIGYVVGKNIDNDNDFFNRFKF